MKKDRTLYLTLSFLIPLLVIIFAYYTLGITPFGDTTILFSDAHYQYINYFAFIRRLLHGEENLFYSFSKGLGGNMFNQVTASLFNPFYLLFYFGGTEDLPAIYAAVCALSLASCGLTMYILLSGLTGDKMTHLIFSSCYALCGYCVVNIWQLLWLFCLIMLPLTVLGIHRLYEGKKPVLYFVSLSLTVLSSYYLGYMICIFSLLYFFMLLYAGKEDSGPLFTEHNRRLTGRFFAASVPAGLVSAFLWAPALISHLEGRLMQVGQNEFDFSEKFPLLEMGAKLFSGASSTDELRNGHPNIFCTLFVVALAVLFIMDRKQEKKKKQGYIVMISFYLLCFLIEAFDSGMHMMSRPSFFNYRYSFIFSFILILMAAQEFERVDLITADEVKKCLLYMLFGTVIIFSQKYEFVTAGMAAFDWAVLLVCVRVLALCRKDPARNPAKAASVLVTLCIGVNLYCNFFFSTVNIWDWKYTYTEYCDGFREPEALVETVRKLDGGFYRMADEEPMTGKSDSDPVLLDYNGVGQFTSTERLFVKENLMRYGIGYRGNGNFYHEAVPSATDALLGLRYIISKRDLTESKGYLLMADTEEKAVYLNPDALPLAVLSEGDLTDINVESENVFYLQNRIWNELSGEETDIYYPVSNILYRTGDVSDEREYLTGGVHTDIWWTEETEETEEEDEEPDYRNYVEYSFTAEYDGPVYMCIGTMITKEYGWSEDAMQYVGTFEKGEQVTGRFMLPQAMTQKEFEGLCDHNSMYYEDAEALKKQSGRILQQDMQISVESERKLSGEFSTDTARTLLFTIPYDEGWELRIDGQKTGYKKVLGLFMAADVPEGEHTWSLSYTPQGFGISLCVSAAAFIFILLWFAFGFGRKSSVKENSDENLNVKKDGEITDDTV